MVTTSAQQNICIGIHVQHGSAFRFPMNLFSCKKMVYYNYKIKVNTRWQRVN